MRKKEKKVKVKIKDVKLKPSISVTGKPRRIPRDVKRMIEYHWGKTPRPCQRCDSPVGMRTINMRGGEGLVSMSYKCWNCGFSTEPKTLPFPKKVREIVRNSSSLGVKTKRGVTLLCMRCNSDRLKLIIKPEDIDPDGVSVTYECPDCGWGAMLTLNYVLERE